MCGRFAIGLPPKSLAEHFKLDAFPDFSQRFNIAPTQDVATVSRGNDNADKAVIRKWGLIPGWAKESKIGAKMINARAESITEKPSFKNPFKSKRCLVPASAFYEWQGKGKNRRPWLISLKNCNIITFAGIFDRWINEDDVTIESFSIITTAANELVKPIHDRMPVILNPERYDAWLDHSTDMATISSFLSPYPADDMERYEVSPLVNNVRNDSPACIEKSRTLFDL